MTDETRVVRTNSFVDEFHVGDLLVTSGGVDLTEEQYKTVRDAGFTNGVSIHLDEEFSTVPQGKDVKLDVPAPATPAPAKKADGDTNGGSL
jgi:hypothetical protein